MKLLAKEPARATLTIAILLLAMAPVSSLSAEYVIGPDDLLEVRFWQEPDLDSRVKVGNDGMITLDVIGRIEAAGKTTEELQNDIVRQISRLNRKISQAAVNVVEFNYNYVFVIGQANEPGKLTFEAIPDLWTIINEAGGSAALGDLSRVTIIRGGDDAGEIEVVDVSKAISSGTLSNLPKVRRQDTIEIPRTPGSVPSMELGRMTGRKNLIYVLGAVGTPGPITYEENIDVLEALALAGGPSPTANLKKVRLVLKDGRFAQTVKLDLEKYAETGRPARYIMQKEDLFIVPERGGGFLRDNLPLAISVIGAITTTVLLIDRR